MQQVSVSAPSVLDLALNTNLSLMRNALVFALNTKLFKHAQISTLTPYFEAICNNVPEFKKFTEKGTYGYDDRAWPITRVFELMVRETSKGDLWFDVGLNDDFRWRMDNIARQMAALRMGIADIGFLMQCTKHRDELSFVDHIVAKSHTSDVISTTEIVKWLAISMLTELCVGDLNRYYHHPTSDVSTLGALGATAAGGHEKVFTVDAGGVKLKFAASILVNMHQLNETEAIHALVWVLNKAPMRMWLSINVDLPHESTHLIRDPKHTRFNPVTGDL